MDRAIVSLLLTTLILLCLVIHYGIKSDRLENELDTTNKMVRTNCVCRPY